MPDQVPRVVVIGAGIVGIASALHARRRGWDVVVIDPRGIAGGASRGNAGILAVSDCVPIGTPSTLKSVPGMLLSRDGPLHIRPRYFPALVPWLLRMLLASRPSQVEKIADALASILARATSAHLDLATAAGVRGSIVQGGWIKAYESERSYRSTAFDLAMMRSRGVECRELVAKDIATLEPALDGRFSNAIFHPECSHVGDPQAYVQALGKLLQSQGATLHAADVHGIDITSGRVTAVRTSSETISADAVVLAAGAWSKKLAASLGCDVPLDTERGYHMMLDASDCKVKLTRPLYWAEKSIVLSPMGGDIRVTSSVEFAGIGAPPDFDLVERFVPDVQSLLPGVKLRRESLWLGFRPSMPDSLPVIGCAPRVPNAVLAFGHGHLGLTLGAVTGEIVGALIDGETPSILLAPFSPARFAG